MRKRTGIQLCYPFESRRLLEAKFGWKWPVIVQPKLDGERCRIICLGDRPPIILSSTERVITSVPHISAQIQALGINCELDGELYIHGESFETISSIVSRTQNIHSDHSSMQYHVFDIINKYNQLSRISDMQNILKNRDSSIIKKVYCHVVYNMAELMIKYHEILKDGYEGIIIRNIASPYLRKRHNMIMKFKPKKTDVYEIIDVIEGSGEHQRMIGAFTCQGNETQTFNVAAGEFSHIERKNLWEDKSQIIGKFLEISYQNITEKGIPRFGIAKQIIDNNYEKSNYVSFL